MAPQDAERALALSYARPEARAALAALLDLDATLGQVLRTTREPLVGQMRLTWWHDALSALDTAPPPAQPVLQALARDVLPRGVAGSALATMIEGWEALLDAEALDPAGLDHYARARGGTLFALAGRALAEGARDPLADAGAGWALAHLAKHLRDAEAAAVARAMARQALASAATIRWSSGGRALGALALIARMDLALPPGTPPAAGSPKRVARLAWLRISGR